jgi:hypothetical protein
LSDLFWPGYKKIRIDPAYTGGLCWRRENKVRPGTPISTSRAIVSVAEENIGRLELIKKVRLQEFLRLNAHGLKPERREEIPAIFEERGDRKEDEARALMLVLDIDSIQQAGQLVELAAGNSYLGILVKARQPEVKVVTFERRERSIKAARGYAAAMGVDIDIQQSDIYKTEIPGGVWLAKHACGPLSDHIIETWRERPDSRLLVIMTCCHGFAVKSPRYGVEPKEWETLCRQSDWTSHPDANHRVIGQATMEKLDNLRVDFLRSGKGRIEAELLNANTLLDQYHIPHAPIIKGNIIVARKI